MTIDGRQIRRRIRSLGWLLVLVIWPLAQAHAACPQRLCDCLGEATAFAVIGADKLSIRHGWLNSYGYVEYSGSSVVGDACGPAVVAAGASSNARTSLDNLFVFAGPGEVAAKFLTHSLYGSTSPGVRVTGVVATGGGSVVGDVTAGSIDTSGTHPSVATCQQATDDIRTASATLAALTPTRDIGRVVLYGEQMDITVGAGVQVINAESIMMRPRKIFPGYSRFSQISIHSQADTEAVIVNTGVLSLGYDCGIFNDRGDQDVIVNVPGPGRAVKIAPYNSIDTPILAPERTVKVNIARVSNISARKAMLRGADVYDSYGSCNTTSSTTSTSSTSTTSLP